MRRRKLRNSELYILRSLCYGVSAFGIEFGPLTASSSLPQVPELSPLTLHLTRSISLPALVSRKRRTKTHRLSELENFVRFPRITDSNIKKKKKTAPNMYPVQYRQLYENHLKKFTQVMNLTSLHTTILPLTNRKKKWFWKRTSLKWEGAPPEMGPALRLAREFYWGVADERC